MVRRDGRHRGVGRQQGTGGRCVTAGGGRHAKVSGGGAGSSAWHVAVAGGTVAVVAALALGVLTAGRVPPTASDPADLTTGTARPASSAPGAGSAATGWALGGTAVATARLGAPVAGPTDADVDPAAAPAARAPRGGQGHHRPPAPPGRPADPGGGRGQRDR